MKVTSPIDDQKGVLACLKLRVLKSVVHKRIVWISSKADWDGLRMALRSVAWGTLLDLPPEDGANCLTDTILEAGIHSTQQSA